MVAGDAAKAAGDAFTAQVDYPLTVVTVGGAGETSGCLVGFVTQCSIDPFRILVCISKVNHTHRVSLQSPGVAVHLLRRDQEELAQLFADETGDDIDKFERCRWHPGRGGAPVLEECAAWVDGLILSRFDAGDHTGLLVGPLAGGGVVQGGLLTFRESPDFRPAHPVAS